MCSHEMVEVEFEGPWQTPSTRQSWFGCDLPTKLERQPGLLLAVNGFEHSVFWI